MPETVPVKKGETIFVQGANPINLVMLQSGTVEILSASKEYEGLDAGIIASKSRRVGLVKAKNLLTAFSGLMNRPYDKTIRAVENCEIVNYPLNPGGFPVLARNEPARAVAIIKQSFNLLNTVVYGTNRYLKLLQTLQIINDNMALLYKGLGGSYAPDDFNERAQELFEIFQSTGGALPDEINAKFLISDCGRYLDKTYDNSAQYGLSKKDKMTLDFIMKIFRMENGVLKQIISSEQTVLETAFSIIIDSFGFLFDSTEEIIDSIESELSGLFSDDISWSTILTDEGGFEDWLESGRVDADFIKDTLGYIIKINSMYEELAGNRMTDNYPGVKKIHQFYTDLKKAEESVSVNETNEIKNETSTENGADEAASSAAVSDLKRSMNQIFEFSLMEKEFQTGFIKLINEFKQSNNPFNTESEERKLRRHISRMYWELYKQVYLRSKTQSSIPKAVRLMLNYGFIDDGLVEPGQLIELNEFIKRKEPDPELPVLKEEEFLERIYNGDEEPSINEMGLNYEKYLQEQEKHKKKHEKTIQVEDESVNKVLFEIGQRLASTVAVCSGSPSTSFPVLTSYAIKGDLSSFRVTKKRVEEIINEIRELDFSAFFRETVFKLDDAREIIKEEVIPYFIIIPSYGTKTQLWQDMVGTNKRSRGRILIPAFFMGDLKKSLVHTIACFRWELNRTMKGALWGDPVDGGLTGEYFDYINNYKKMTKLSQEAKEKVTERFKSLRTNRDRFADDYSNWILFEKDGIMKLNSAVREMFCKHVPFKKELRTRLETMPAFTKNITRYNNINAKEIESYRRRYQKYMREDGTLPPELENYIKFLEM